MDERNERRAVGVVLDCRHAPGDAGLVAFEINHTVVALVPAAAMPDRQLPAVVAPGDARLRLEQRLVRCRGGDLLEGQPGLKPPRLRVWPVSLDPHKICPAQSCSRANSPRPKIYAVSAYSGIFSPARSFTYAFFQSARKPNVRPRRRNLPWKTAVCTDSTLTLNTACTACLISNFVACRSTRKQSVRARSLRSIPFSVITGFRRI